MAELDTHLSRIFKSSVLIASGIVLGSLLAILTKIALGRMLGPSEYGLLFQGIAIIGLFEVIAVFGFRDAVTKALADKSSDSDIMTSGMLVSTAFASVIALIVFGLSEAMATSFGTPVLDEILKIMSFSLPASTIFTIVLGGFRGKNRTAEKIFSEVILYKLSLLIISSSLVYLYGSAIWAAWAYLLSMWLAALSALFLYLKKFEVNAPRLENIKALTKFSTPLGISEISNHGLRYANIVILGFLLSSSDAGFYAAALPISYALIIVLEGASYLTLPSLTELKSNGSKDEIETLYKTLSKWLILINTPLLLSLVLKPEFVLGFLYGPSFSGSGTLLGILSIAMFLDSFFGPLGDFLIAFDRNVGECISSLLGLISLLLVSIFTINLFGSVGASLGYLAGISVMSLSRLFFIRRDLKITPLFDQLAFNSLIALIPGTMLLIEVKGTTSNIISIILFLTAYLILILALNPFSPRELSIIESYLQNLEKQNIFSTYGLHVVEKLKGRQTCKWFN